MINWNPQWGSQGDLGTHKGYLYNPDEVINVKDMKLGRVISFSYQSKGDDKESARLVFILHPNFEGKCHALTLKFISRENLLDDIYPCLRSGIDNPIDFYYKIYRPTYLYSTDSYRTYNVNKMKNIVQFSYSDPESDIHDDNFEYDDASKSEIYKMFEEGKGLDDLLKFYKESKGKK